MSLCGHFASLIILHLFVIILHSFCDHFASLCGHFASVLLQLFPVIAHLFVVILTLCDHFVSLCCNLIDFPINANSHFKQRLCDSKGSGGWAWPFAKEVISNPSTHLSYRIVVSNLAQLD